MSRAIDSQSAALGRTNPSASTWSVIDILGVVLRALASLRLTVVLFSLSLILVFCGTLAQVDNGIETVVRDYFRSWHIIWIPFQVFFPRSTSVGGSFPFLGGWLIGAALLTNLISAHAVRFRLGWPKLDLLKSPEARLRRRAYIQIGRRLGILMIHSGILLLLVGELITGVFQVEGRMEIPEGSSASFVTIPSAIELAFIDPSDPKKDDVVVIPQRILRDGGRIHSADLPVDVVVEKYLTNSDLVRAKPGDSNPATAGVGLQWRAEAVPDVTGTDRDQRVNAASLYVTLKKKNSDETLGTYLASLILSMQNPDAAQSVDVDGRDYQVQLRMKRVYKPYTLHLNKFSNEVYLGTTIPKNYSSDVRLVDPTQKEDRELTIWMNHPLRHSGETFFQADWLRNVRGTVLQVVRNPGWELPYLACALVGGGMLLYFLLKLDLPATKSVAMTGIELWMPPAIVILAAAYLVAALVPQWDRRDEMQIRDAGRIPVVEGGRVKPLDTVARTSLMIVSHQQDYKDAEGKTQPAIRWLLDVMSTRLRKGDDPALSAKVFRIENDQLLGLLGLTERPGFRYSLNEFSSKIPDLKKQVDVAQAKKKGEQDAFDIQALELARHLEMYVNLADMQNPHLVPPQGEGKDWQTMVDVLHGGAAAARQNADVRALLTVLNSYSAGKTGSMNATLADYRADLKSRFPSAVFKADLEVFFNQAAPFLKCLALYVGVFLLAVLGWLLAAFGSTQWARAFWRTAFWLMALVLVAHTCALVTRMYLQGRPPVTNLYSSAIFIGWAAVVLGLVLEFFYRNGLGAILGGVVGFLTLLIAHNLASDGDTMEMMQAVLDTNFWLATHVTCVTIGYTATFAAGLLGIIYILLGFFTPVLDKETSKVLSTMIYAVVCFATLMSFVGTVLGGIWADQSWGRFWGWDPKENGALLIVIWNSLLLHARWSGIIRQRGVATLAVFGNVITSWSWFGVNMLGVGLHSYGFMQSAAFWMAVFWISQFVLIGIGSLPLSMWQSFIAQGRQPPPRVGPDRDGIIEATAV